MYWTEQFEELWRQSISGGMVDAVTGETNLGALARFLAVDPRYFPEFEAEGEQIDLRWAPFLRTETYRVEIWYSVVEDDLCVYLESVEVIHRAPAVISRVRCLISPAPAGCATISPRSLRPAGYNEFDLTHRSYGNDMKASELVPVEANDNIPAFQPGDTVRVNFRIREGARERVQAFQGVCIRRTHGTGPAANFTVRRVTAGIGIERVFPLHSPLIESLEVTRQGKVRRAKLYYLRGRQGRAARIKERTTYRTNR